MRRAVKTMCNMPPLFSRATFPSLIVFLCLAYSKLLKLMAAWIAGVVYDKTAIDNWCLSHASSPGWHQHTGIVSPAIHKMTHAWHG